MGTARKVVTENMLASRAGSGTVDVFSTPNLVLLMEEAAMNAIGPYLDPGETSVGTAVNIRHLAATPLGLVVTATARLSEVDGRRLVFEVSAADDVEKVGEGIHERVLVSESRFKLRADEKAAGTKKSTRT